PPSSYAKTLASRLNPDTSFPTAVFAFPRTLVPAAPISEFVLDDKNWSTRAWSDSEEWILVCLMSLRTDTAPVLPNLDRQRGLFVMTKMDEIRAWEQRKEGERDTKFVELGRYLCEVRAGQYWRLENLKSFDEFLEQRFPESRRKAYYLMSIHE